MAAKKEQVAHEWEGASLNGPCTVVRVSVDNCRKVDDGSGDWEIFVPVQPMSTDDNKVLERLFPNTEHLIGKALGFEALLARIQ